MRASQLTLVCAGLGLVAGNMYDVTMPSYSSTCKNGCAAWASAGDGNATQQGVIDAMFAGGRGGSEAAAAHCAMPANHAGDNECDCGQKDGETYIFDSYEGPWCYCRAPAVSAPRFAYCNPPASRGPPEQINLQVAARDVVVVGFVTYEKSYPNASAPLPAPVAEFGPVGGANTTLAGLSQLYAPQPRSVPGSVDGTGRYTYPYTMSYIRFDGLVPGGRYAYRVKAGGDGAPWSETFVFRVPTAGGAAAGPTRIATYGDMGHSHYNNMGNLHDDCAAGRIDAILHMGDHAYDIGFSNDRRGDAYMNAFQRALATCPWFPIVGNHEYSHGPANLQHYEAIAYGEFVGEGPAKLSTTATSALGAHMTAGTFFAAGLHGGAHPSNTSRYSSTDVGLIHIVGLDLNNLDAAQLAWLDTDLAAANANRAETPWIMVSSHFPLFHSATQGEHAGMSLAHYLGDENRDDYALNAKGMDFVPCGPAATAAGNCTTIGEWTLKMGSALQPLFKKYGVDIYNAGHVHSYESSWPICDLTTGALCPNGKSFTSPQGPVHVTDGNGGVPGTEGAVLIYPDCTHGDPRGTCPPTCPTPGHFCRLSGTGGAYARVTAWNATTLTYDHVANDGGAVHDSWTIVQPSHGSFEHMR